MTGLERAIMKYPLPWSRLLTPANSVRMLGDTRTAYRLLVRLRNDRLPDLFPPIESQGEFDLEGAALASALTERLLRARLFPFRRTCLRRCLVLYHLFAKYGLSVRVAFGIDPTGEDWEGHCWLVHEDAPFLEPPDATSDYHAVFELPLAARDERGRERAS